MKKRVLGLVLAAVLLLSVGVLPTYAADGAFLYDTVTDRTGAYSYAVVTGYTGSETVVTVPAEMDGLPVRHIRSLAGGECPERLVIPSSVRVVQGLFADMSALREIEMPGSTAILHVATLEGSSALIISVPQGDIHLTTLTLPEGVTLRVERGTGIAKAAGGGDLAGHCTVFPCDYTTGDLNADGVCNTTDARMGLQHAAGRATLTDEQVAVADVDGNGAVNTTDARLMLQYAAGRAEVEAITVPAKREVTPFLDASVVKRVHIQTGTQRLGYGEISTRDSAASNPDHFTAWMEEFNRMIQEAVLQPNPDIFDLKPDAETTYSYEIWTVDTAAGTVMYRSAFGQTGLYFDDVWYQIVE